ncbi:glycoside hydrolase family 127 protein [Mucilaginibacter roseus]|uniref:Glycoside hydrolase family 127 protein n=1 Tax=Mucilaginibacter roseus TaxID=1528868 RepID=A0ABS8TY07_9SPHI|nr:beta-L-arabinofuranosidase domain-containing protein [Mucilaginibacter roseus]MCD8739768.1 glycoside hydrolase family 127 protein [Mucilaginibacter roseus]
MIVKYTLTALLAGIITLVEAAFVDAQNIKPVDVKHVKINNGFWSPKLKVIHDVTVYDVLDKLEGNYKPDREDLIKEKEKTGRTRNAFLNFDRVAQGKSNIGQFDGPPWYDGLVYESIRGAADLLIAQPDKKLEQKLDAYIERIAKAQAADPEGYINTYTTLNRPAQRWGTNGGDDRWQHDLYNAGMLVEAGVHYYDATGKTKLLGVAVKMADYMCKVIGDAPKMNIIPGHAGPEEAFFKLYLLLKAQPELANKLNTKATPDAYLHLAKYWIEHRGFPADADGARKRQAYGSYNQDDQSVFTQQTIEGHAVRATLLGTAISAIGAYKNDQRYINTANRYWDNMAGKRTFITGGQGAIAEDEKFGPDYYLPESAYLETCAAIGAAFFSQRMNELQADGKYMDEFERALYNNILAGVSLDGRHYHYENPLQATNHPRWEWHSCPCCPPMILKMAGALPGFIYGTDAKNGVYVNLFIGSNATIGEGKSITRVSQKTEYPWKGAVNISVDPETTKSFSVYVRIPGWATGTENPFGLYNAEQKGKVALQVNGQAVPVNIQKGYAVITRKWKKGDKIMLSLPMEPRVVSANTLVKELNNKRAIAAGPLVYAFEANDNKSLNVGNLTNQNKLDVKNQPDLLNGINIIKVKASNSSSALTAIPFYSIGNRGNATYQVWLQSQ